MSVIGLRLFSSILYIISGICGVATAVFITSFYFSFWQWREYFNNEGRYFHEPDSSVYHDQSAFLIIPIIVFAIASITCAVVAKALRKII